MVISQKLHLDDENWNGTNIIQSVHKIFWIHYILNMYFLHNNKWHSSYNTVKKQKLSIKKIISDMILCWKEMACQMWNFEGKLLSNSFSYNRTFLKLQHKKNKNQYIDSPAIHLQWYLVINFRILFYVCCCCHNRKKKGNILNISISSRIMNSNAYFDDIWYEFDVISIIFNVSNSIVFLLLCFYIQWHCPVSLILFIFFCSLSISFFCACCYVFIFFEQKCLIKLFVDKLLIYNVCVSFAFAAHKNIFKVTNLDVWWASKNPKNIVSQECDSLLHFVLTVGISLVSSFFLFILKKTMMTFLYHRSSSHMVAHAVRLKLIISFIRINIKLFWFLLIWW